VDTNKKKILLGVSASIAAYRALDLITELRAAGYAVRVAMTKDAQHFVTPLSLQSLAASRVITDFFSVDAQIKPIHIELAQESDAVLIAPASADVLAKISHGLADDVITCTVLATEAPIVVVPAMNEKMYNNPFTRENLERLKKNGVRIVPPVHGHMVCSGEGMGHIAENAAILAALREAIASKK